MTHENADEYHVTEAEFRKYLHDYPSRDEMEEINRKYLPPNREKDEIIKGMNIPRGFKKLISEDD